MNVSVAVISDLHIGSGAKSKDFSLAGTDAVIDDYLIEFRNFITSEDIKADYLLIPGDITNSACEPEFELASERISQVAACLQVPESKILFCPGNHDVDWAIIEVLEGLNHTESQIIKSKYLNFLDGGLFNRNLATAIGRFDESPYLVAWEFDDAIVCALNTSAFDGPNKKPHCGEVRPDQLTEIDRFLAGLGRSDKLKLFIFHHHPLQYLDVTFTAPDFSIMSNAAGLLDVISKHQFDFIVHGHKHIPRFKMEIMDDGHPLNILCAGSFSASLDHKYFEAVGNNFHLIDFHDRCPDSKYARGSVRTWTHFSGRGWTPSLRRTGVERQQNFGAFLPRPQLVARLRLTLEQEFNQTQFIIWSNFVDKHPEFKYFTNETLRASLKEISEAINLVLHEIDALSLEQLVILKG